MVAIVDSIRRSAVEVDQQQSLAGGQFGALVVLPYGCSIAAHRLIGSACRYHQLIGNKRDSN